MTEILFWEAKRINLESLFEQVALFFNGKELLCGRYLIIYQKYHVPAGEYLIVCSVIPSKLQSFLSFDKFQQT